MGSRVAAGTQGSLAAQLFAREDRDLFWAVDQISIQAFTFLYTCDTSALPGTTDGRINVGNKHRGQAKCHPG